jgi:hypothetical protein
MKKIKTKKLPSLKTLKNKLVKEFNSYIKERDKKCILTGDKVGLQCSHYYDARENPYLRFDERNAHAMANHKGNAVHFKHHHGKAPDYALWMFTHHTIDFMEQLKRDSKKKIIFTRKYYEKMILYYQEKREGLK